MEALDSVPNGPSLDCGTGPLSTGVLGSVCNGPSEALDPRMLDPVGPVFSGPSRTLNPVFMGPSPDLGPRTQTVVYGDVLPSCPSPSHRPQHRERGHHPGPLRGQERDLVGSLGRGGRDAV